MKKLETDIQRLVKNWDKIPDSFKSFLKPYSYSKGVPGLALEEHFVILLLDRQKPSVKQSWDFDEERIGLTRTGKIIWGFDSGCSCPSPWNDFYPDCYNVSKEWKEFEVNLKDFDSGVLEEIQTTIDNVELMIR